MNTKTNQSASLSNTVDVLAHFSAMALNYGKKWQAAHDAVAELIDFVRSTPCHCCAELGALPAVQCERCRLLACAGGAR